MRAYLAILKDSFREALASRVLLIALAGIVIVLALLSPFGLDTDKATELRRGELIQPERFLAKLVNGAEEELTPQAHIWSLLNNEQRERVNGLLTPKSDDQRSGRGGPVGNPLRRQLVDQINTLLQHDKFYHAPSWEAVKLSEEASELIGRSDLTDNELKRRNLLLMAAAFSREVDITDSTALSLTYAGASVVGPFPLTRSQFEPIFNRIVVGVVGVFLGFFGVLGTLLVTAGIIPRTFESGEIALLLSKPVRRSLLFLTKFLGGCVFTLLYATVLVVGIWLLLGFRMGAWQHGLLWCIPVYVFLFMIYYSVSAVAGAIWRNSIVALTLVVLFWLGLTVIGVTDQALQQNLVRQRGIKEITVAGANLISVDGEQNTYSWNAASSSWNETFEEPPDRMSAFARRFLASSVRFAPVYDSAGDRILALQVAQSRFGGMGVPELVMGSADDDWERTSLGRVPDVVSTILIGNDGRIILPSADKLYEFIGQTQQEKRQTDFLGGITGGLLGRGSKAFREVQPKGMPDLDDHFAAAIDRVSNNLLLFGKGQLHELKALEDGTYSPGRSRNFETDDSGLLAVAADHAILGLADGRVLVLNAESLETVYELQLADGILPRVCTAADDGSSLAVLTHAETVLLFDGKSGQPLTWQPPENGSCSAIAYAPDGQLLVSDGRLAVRKYNVPTGEQLEEWSETTSWVYRFYDYVIHPVWTVLPKPSQLDEFVTYLNSGEKSVLVNDANGPPGIVDRDSLQQERDTFEPIPVIRDNMIFVIVILFLGCVYVSRTDY